MSEAGGSPQLSLSGFSSLFSISSSTSAPAPHLDLRGAGDELPSLSLSVGGDLQQQASMSDDDEERKTVRMMKNRESALRSRARKRAYVQELEKEVRRLVDDNLKLKRQCKQLKKEMAALLQSTKTPHRRTSSTQF